MKPLVSYLLFAYNHERFIEEALQSAFAQDYEPMEIIVTDDCSTDRTADTIEQVLAAYSGSKITKFNRHSKNTGVAIALNNAVALAEGEIFIGAAGDDVSIPSRTATIVKAFGTHQDVRCVYSNAEMIDASGNGLGVQFSTPRNPPTLQNFKTHIHGGTAAYRREIFDVFGPVDGGLKAEDQVLALRSFVLGRIIYLHAPLVRYRRHTTNAWFGTSDRVKSARDRWDFARTRNWMWLTVKKNRQRDLDTALAKFPELRRDLLAARKANSRELKHAELESRMYEKGGFLTTLATTVKMILSAPDKGYVKRWVSLFILPGRRP